MRLIKVAVACVNQTPLAWDENFANLARAVAQARTEGASVLCLPELAITGYACEDTFFMDGLQDTAFAQLEALAALELAEDRALIESMLEDADLRVRRVMAQGEWVPDLREPGRAGVVVDR